MLAIGINVIKYLPSFALGLLVGLGLLYNYTITLNREASTLSEEAKQLAFKLSNAEARINSLSESSYDIAQIKKCMLSSKFRSRAIEQIIYTQNRDFTPYEKIEYQKLIPILEKAKNSSANNLMHSLESESSKLDNECLQQAKHISHG